MRLEEKLANTLILRTRTIACAESCTGGLLAHLITNVPGSSVYFKGGVIAYANEAKTKLLGVPPLAMKRFGAISVTVAQAMARGVRRKFKTNLGIAITGIAGPGGATAEKPVGLVFIAIASGKGSRARRFQFQGSRLKIKQQAAQAALTWIIQQV